MEPATSWFLVRFVATAPQKELQIQLVLNPLIFPMALTNGVLQAPASEGDATDLGAGSPAPWPCKVGLSPAPFL